MGVVCGEMCAVCEPVLAAASPSTLPTKENE